MNPMLQKLIDQDFMTAEQADYITEAVANKDNIIISGHRGYGILPLLASLGAVAQSSGKLKPVRNIENDLADDSFDYFLIGDLKDVDYPELLTSIFADKNSSVITIKDADHSFSLMKILRDVYKKNSSALKSYQLIECTKDENEVKRITKIVNVTQTSAGKLERTTIK